MQAVHTLRDFFFFLCSCNEIMIKKQNKTRIIITEQVDLAFPTFPHISVKGVLMLYDCHSSNMLNKSLPHTLGVTAPTPCVTQKASFLDDCFKASTVV